VWTTLRRSEMDGLAERIYRRNVLIVQLAVVSLFCVVFPALEDRVHGFGGDSSSWRFNWSMLLSLILCLATVQHGSFLARVWTLLAVQPWEASDGGRSRAGGSSKDELLTYTRLALGGGSIALGAALLLNSHLASGQSLQGWLGLLAFAAYLVAALAFAGFAAHRRKTAQWQLAGCSVPARVASEWGRTGTDIALASLAGASLLAALHVLDVARASAAWLGSTLLLPLLRLLPWGWFKIPAPHVCTAGACTRNGGQIPPPTPRFPPHVAAHSEAGFWVLVGNLWHALFGALQALASQWPLLLCLGAVLALLRIYVSHGHARAWAGLVRSLVSMLSRYLHMISAFLPAPARRIAGRARAFIARGPGQVNARFRRLRGPALDGLPARQAVVAVYLAAVEHATRRGFARRPGQTPAEYACELASRVPEVGDAAIGLTEVFVAARYGPERVEGAEVERARDAWQRLRAILRRQRRKDVSGS
jgi:hypothetical protein